MRVFDHGALDMESAITKEYDFVSRIGMAKIRRRASQNFSLWPWLTLWQGNVCESSLLLKHSFGQQQGAVELNDAHKHENLIFSITEVFLHTFYEKFYVKFDLHKHIKSVLYNEIRNGHEATMTIMHDEIASQLLTSNIVDTASSICYIAQYQTLNLAKLAHDVSDKSRM